MKSLIPILSLFLIFSACSKTTTILADNGDTLLTKLSTLPTELKESSGLEIAASGTFWSHNDHGNKAALYAFDKNGSLSQILNFDNISNVDWEDLAEDDAGNLYIGDFGNNDNDRKDLVIYKVAKENLSQNNNKNLVEKITFSFEDQTAFPPIESEQLFDVEAFFYKKNALYLLTRDRSKPFKGVTRLYRLPNTAGNHQAVFLAEFKTADKKNKGQITAADISPDGTTLALLSNEVLWLFNDFSGEDFFSGTVTRKDLAEKLQLESIVFQDNCTLYLTNEEKSKEPASLYTIRLCP